MSEKLQLTVVIRDANPMRFLNEPCAYRTVRFELTPEQVKQLALRHEEEAYNSVYLEPTEAGQ